MEWLPRESPVDIEAVEFVGSQELGRVVNELIHAENAAGEILERRRCHDPSTDGQEDLEILVPIAQLLEALVRSDQRRFVLLVIGHQGEPVVAQRTIGEDEVGAQSHVHVFGSEAPDARPLIRPARVVAHQLGVASWNWSKIKQTNKKHDSIYANLSTGSIQFCKLSDWLSLSSVLPSHNPSPFAIFQLHWSIIISFKFWDRTGSILNLLNVNWFIYKSTANAIR